MPVPKKIQRRDRMNKLNIVIIGIFCIAIIACGNNKFEGEYVSKPADTQTEKLATRFFGKQKLSFRADGKVVVFLGDHKLGTFKYEKDGDEITLFKLGNTTEIFTLEDDGSLLGGGVEYIKSSKTAEEDVTSKFSHDIIGENYVSKPDPAFNPEYATVAKLFFESENEMKLSMKFYDTGKFRENELMFKYEVNGDKITSNADNGVSLVLTIREDGSLIDANKTEFIKENE
ncbi:MAG: hypothetical protein ACI84K_001969 [Pseudohongiellaceae bacterium]|jgi:hypothetical protein